MGISIVIKLKNKDQKKYLLNNSCKIGRSSVCHIIIDDPKVSSEHIEIQLLPTGILRLVDLSSRNGSYLNGFPVSEDYFRLNDLLRIGDTDIFLSEEGLTVEEKNIIGERVLEVLEQKKYLKKSRRK